MPADVHDTAYQVIMETLNNRHKRQDPKSGLLDFVPNLGGIGTDRLIDALDWLMAYGAFLYEKDNIQGRD